MQLVFLMEPVELRPGEKSGGMVEQTMQAGSEQIRLLFLMRRIPEDGKEQRIVAVQLGSAEATFNPD
jgi:hypothetical protein